MHHITLKASTKNSLLVCALKVAQIRKISWRYRVQNICSVRDNVIIKLECLLHSGVLFHGAISIQIQLLNTKTYCGVDKRAQAPNYYFFLWSDWDIHKWNKCKWIKDDCYCPTTVSFLLWYRCWCVIYEYVLRPLHLHLSSAFPTAGVRFIIRMDGVWMGTRSGVFSSFGLGVVECEIQNPAIFYHSSQSC